MAQALVPQGVPPAVEQGLAQFVTEAREAFGEDLRAVVLFGSAVDGALRAASDVNVLVVLRRFDASKAGRIGNAVALARAAIKLAPMFVLEAELPLAAHAFAVKFADILRRHRMLHGDDPLVGLAVPRAARIDRLRQVLLNLALRLRAALIDCGGREEQLASAIAQLAAPLRASAATLLEVEASAGSTPKAASTSKAALLTIAREFDRERADRLLPEVSRARETLRVSPGTGAATALLLIDLALAMGVRVEKQASRSAP